MDYKILSKILALRIEKVLCSIVDADQTGFIKGRNSYYNTRHLFNIIHYVNFHQILGLVVSMDVEKVFDRIKWEYMFETMRRFGFRPHFMCWIKIIYNSPLASVLTNWSVVFSYPIWQRYSSMQSPIPVVVCFGHSAAGHGH